MNYYNTCTSLCINIISTCFMYKYDINMYDWGKPLNIVMMTVYAYDGLHTDVDIQCTCTANAIVDLCQDRDTQRYDVFTSSDINDNLKILYTNYKNLICSYCYPFFFVVLY